MCRWKSFIGLVVTFGAGLLAFGEHAQAEPQSLILELYAPDHGALAHLRLAQNRGSGPTPAPNPSPSIRPVLDTRGLTAANLLTARLRAAKFDQNLQIFLNHADLVGAVIDQITARLPRMTQIAAQQRQPQPPDRRLPPERQQQVIERIRPFHRLTVVLSALEVANSLNSKVGQAILDFKVATTPIRVERIELVASKPRNRLSGVIHLAQGESMDVSVLLWLKTPGGTLVTPRGIAHDFLESYSIFDEHVEDVVEATIRGTLTDWLHPVITRVRSDNYHPGTPRQSQIYDRALVQWLEARGAYHVDIPEQDSGPVDVTDSRVLLPSQQPSGHVGIHWDGPLGMRIMGVNPGTTRVFVKMNTRFRELYAGHGDLVIHVDKHDDKPGAPPHPSPASRLPPPLGPSPSRSPSPPSPSPAPGATPAPTPAPAPSPAPGDPSLQPGYCVMLPSGWWNDPERCVPK